MRYWYKYLNLKLGAKWRGKRGFDWEEILYFYAIREALKQGKSLQDLKNEINKGGYKRLLGYLPQEPHKERIKELVLKLEQQLKETLISLKEIEKDVETVINRINSGYH